MRFSPFKPTYTVFKYTGITMHEPTMHERLLNNLKTFRNQNPAVKFKNVQYHFFKEHTSTQGLKIKLQVIIVQTYSLSFYIISLIR